MCLGLLLLLGALLALPGAGLAPIERAEIYFVDAARAMVESGDLLVPRYRGEPFFDKPPLTYWLVAAAFDRLGFTLAAARAVSGLASLLAILATVLLGRALLDAPRALCGGLMLATTLAFMGFARVAMSDMLLVLWSTLAMALAAAWLKSRAGWLLVGTGAVLGLGFLTKGPVALLLPGLGLALLAARQRGEARWPSAAWLAAAGLAFAACGLSWFAALYLRLGVPPLEYFFLHENLERFAGGTYDSGRGAWYYLVTYLGEGLPWSLFLVPALARLVRERRTAESAGARLLAAWLGAMLVPLSLSRGKIDYYLLPLYPAASLLLADYFLARWRPSERAWAQAALALLGVALLAAPALGARIPEAWLPGPAERGGLAAGAAILGALSLACAARFSKPRALAALAASAGLVFLAVVAVLAPAFRRAQPNAAIVADVQREQLYEPRVRLVFCDDPTNVERDLLFETRVAAVERCDLWNPASSRFPFLVMLRKSQRGDLLAIPDLRLVGEYRFLPASAVGLRGFLAGEPPDDLAILANYWTPDPEAARRARKLRKRLIREREEAGDRR